MSLQRSLLFAFLLAPTALPALAESGDFTGLVDIGGGRSMYLECRGTAAARLHRHCFQAAAAAAGSFRYPTPRPANT